MTSRSFILLIMLFGISSVPAFADEFLTAKNLLKENQPEEAYTYLTTKEAYHMGEPEYDLLLARSALKSARTHEAIFAYERVLINQPNNYPAKLELAVAYYQINELENARRLFNETLISIPPDNIQKDIYQYLERINERINSRKHGLGTEISLRQGWDSNINSATNESEIELTVGTYRPTEGVDKETSDSFTELLTRLNYKYNLNVNSRLFSSVGYSNRENNNKQFDTQKADARFGYSHITGIGRISIPVSYQTMWLDEKQLREVTTISTNLNRFDKGSFTDYNLQYGEIRYPYQTPLDVDFIAASFAFGISNKQSGFSQQYAVFYGDETPTNSIYKFNARQYHGLQVRFPLRLGQKHILTPKAVYQVGEYKQRHPFFKEKRKDEYSYLELNWQWFFSKNWNLATQLGHTKSQSTVPIYTHTRNLIFIGINYTH